MYPNAGTGASLGDLDQQQDCSTSCRKSGGLSRDLERREIHIEVKSEVIWITLQWTFYELNFI